MSSLRSAFRLALLGASLTAINASSCSDARLEGRSSAAKRSSALAQSTVTIDVSLREQRITGFGASSAWTTTLLSEEQADFLFSEPAGLGISILRLHIKPDGSTDEAGPARAAAARGVRLWAAPWSPPGDWKTNGTDNNGGSLLAEYYQPWAERLAAFVTRSREDGYPLYGISAQNEPNWTADWETCRWTPQELQSFVGDYLRPALDAENPNTAIIAPESANWNEFDAYANALLEDPESRAAVAVVATHSYGGFAHPYAAAEAAGKEFWETEVSYTDAQGVAAALGAAKLIHNHLTVARVNAWHYWWINSDDDSSLIRSGEVLPQAYALGHFSKFVRPGAYRLSLEPAQPSSGLYITAFAHEQRQRLVIVGINQNTNELTQHFELGSFTPTHVTPWLTAEGKNLEPQTPLAVDSSFDFTFPASSIVTLVSDPDPITFPPQGGTAGAPNGGAGGDGGNDAEGGAAIGGAGGAGGGTDGDGGSAIGGAAGSSDGGGSERGGDGGASNGGRGSGGASSGGRAGVGGRSSGGRVASEGGLGNLGGSAGSQTNEMGGADAKPLPEQPFLPGCYCATTHSSPEPRGASLLAALASAALLRRRRARPS